MVAQILKEMVSFCVTKLNVKQSLFLIEYNVVVVFFLCRVGLCVNQSSAKKRSF